jgi:hypothetical protein
VAVRRGERAAFQRPKLCARTILVMMVVCAMVMVMARMMRGHLVMGSIESRRVGPRKRAHGEKQYRKTKQKQTFHAELRLLHRDLSLPSNRINLVCEDKVAEYPKEG